MTVLYIILPLAIIMAVAFVVGFAWCVRSGQFDDVDTPAMRMLDASHDAGAASSRENPARRA